MSNDTLLHKFNEGLLDLREIFHATGRLDDSNSKLDEIAKFLCLEIASAYEPKAGVPALSALVEKHGKNGGLVEELNSALYKASRLDLFLNSDGESLLGNNL